MSETQSFLIDVLRLIPNGAVCFIQAPSSENPGLLDLMKPSKFEYYKQIPLTAENKEQLINLINNDQEEEAFHSLEIRFNNELLFDGYDGMEIGIISKTLQLPAYFVQQYIQEGICTVSGSW